MNYSTYFSPCFVYSVLTLIGPQLTNGLECYTHTDTDNKTIRTARKGEGCFIDKDTKKRGSYELITLEPEKTHCVLRREEEPVRCYCSTDLCNEHLPSPLPDIQPLPTNSLTCVQHPPRKNETTCKGSICFKGRQQNGGTTVQGCLDVFFGSKRSGCVKEAYLPQGYTRMCVCDTDMCDPFAQSDPNGRSSKRLHTINVLMVVFLAWMVSE